MHGAPDVFARRTRKCNAPRNCRSTGTRNDQSCAVGCERHAEVVDHIARWCRSRPSHCRPPPDRHHNARSTPACRSDRRPPPDRCRASRRTCVNASVPFASVTESTLSSRRSSGDDRCPGLSAPTEVRNAPEDHIAAHLCKVQCDERVQNVDAITTAGGGVGFRLQAASAHRPSL